MMCFRRVFSLNCQRYRVRIIYFQEYFFCVVSEKEEKAIAAIKKEPIQVDQFLHKLRQKKLDKYLNFEVRVTFLYPLTGQCDF